MAHSPLPLVAVAVSGLRDARSAAARAPQGVTLPRYAARPGRPGFTWNICPLIDPPDINSPPNSICRSSSCRSAPRSRTAVRSGCEHRAPWTSLRQPTRASAVSDARGSDARPPPRDACGSREPREATRLQKPPHRHGRHGECGLTSLHVPRGTSLRRRVAPRRLPPRAGVVVERSPPARGLALDQTRPARGLAPKQSPPALDRTQAVTSRAQARTRPDTSPRGLALKQSPPALDRTRFDSSGHQSEIVSPAERRQCAPDGTGLLTANVDSPSPQRRRPDVTVERSSPARSPQGLAVTFRARRGRAVISRARPPAPTRRATCRRESVPPSGVTVDRRP